MNEWARCIRCVEPASDAGRNAHPKVMLRAGSRTGSHQRGDLRAGVWGRQEERVHGGCLERDFRVMNRKETGRMEGADVPGCRKAGESRRQDEPPHGVCAPSCETVPGDAAFPTRRLREL